MCEDCQPSRRGQWCTSGRKKRTSGTDPTYDRSRLTSPGGGCKEDLIGDTGGDTAVTFAKLWTNEVRAVQT